MMKIIECTNERGIPIALLVDLDNDNPEYGIPLLDLACLGLPEDLEDQLRLALWHREIKSYYDLLAATPKEIAAAIRASLKLSVSTLLEVAKTEIDLLTGEINND